MYDHLSKIDLNLLIVLKILLEEENTVRAAERLKVTQSAVSRILGRLREQFDDEIFIRSSHGLTPTPKAKELEPQLIELMDSIQHLTGIDHFNASLSEAEICIGAPEPMSIRFMPQLLEIVENEAPHIKIYSHNIIDGYLDHLNEGTLDFCLYQYDSEPKLISEYIGQTTMVCAMRKGHPLAKHKTINKSMLLNAKRILYTSPLAKTTGLKDFIDESRLKKEELLCSLESSQLMLAAEMLMRTDAVMLTIPGIKDLSICCGNLVEIPLGNMPAINSGTPIHITQHERTRDLPQHQWILKHIKRIIGETFPAK